MPTTVTLSNKELEDFRLSGRMGFPNEATLKSIVLTHQVAGIWLDLSRLPIAVTAQALYPAVRNIARMIDEDCKQMGLVVPVVVAIQPPNALDDEARKKWAQMDADTDLNAGEFLVRLLSSQTGGNAVDDSSNAEFQQTILGEFSPKDLIEPVRPRADADYRISLRESSSQSRTKMHTYLLRECIEPNWDSPEKIVPFLQDLAATLSRPPGSAHDSAPT
jgi:hypothetical protein